MIEPRNAPSAPPVAQSIRNHGVTLAEGAEERVTQRLRAAGIAVVPLYIDVADYQAYYDAAGYATRYPEYYPWNIREKSLEHYLAAQLLSLSPDDCYIDIASEHSPAPEIYQRLYGCETLRQDLAFPPGLHGDTIGSDAADMPVPDGSASRMALHCSFEHFEGDADRRFVAEARRVLRPGGRLCVVPLYLAEEYCIQTDPTVTSPEGVPFEPDAIVHYASGWGNRFGRFYDVEHMLTRVIGSSNGLTATIFRLVNYRSVDETCYARFALLLSKPH